MDRLYRETFIVADNLRWDPVFQHIRLVGQIACYGDLVITVEKALKILDGEANPLVQTVSYAYNASVRSHGTIRRYDNAEHHGFATPHHRHDFDWRSNVENNGSPVHVGDDGWPTLARFIREMQDWFNANRDSLPNPSGVPVLETKYSPRTFGED